MGTDWFFDTICPHIFLPLPTGIFFSFTQPVPFVIINIDSASDNA
jgi:hypothetical protein